MTDIIKNMLLSHHSDAVLPIMIFGEFSAVILSVLRAKAGVRYE